MWILLKLGEKRREGDQMCCGRGSWYNPCEETWEAWESGREPGEIVRREMSGVELLDHLVKTDDVFKRVLGAYIRAQIEAETGGR